MDRSDICALNMSLRGLFRVRTFERALKSGSPRSVTKREENSNEAEAEVEAACTAYTDCHEFNTVITTAHVSMCLKLVVECTMY